MKREDIKIGNKVYYDGPDGPDPTGLILAMHTVCDVKAVWILYDDNTIRVDDVECMVNCYELDSATTVTTS